MSLVKVALPLIFLTVLAVAQDKATQTRQLDCSKLALPSAGCASYNEMISSNDKDILSTIDHAGTFACFLSGEDSFILITLNSPEDFLFHKSTNPRILEARGEIWLSKYKKGLTDDFQVADGMWRKIVGDTESAPIFRTSKNSTPAPAASAGESEVSFSYSYKNVGGGTTNYSFTMRRSTLRFQQTLQWTLPPKDPKKSAEHGSDEDDGYCLAVN